MNAAAAQQHTARCRHAPRWCSNSSSSTAALVASAARRSRVRLAPRAAQQQPDLGKQAQEFARSTSQKFSSFVKDQELDRKAVAAYEEASQQLRTSYMKLEAEYDLGRKISTIQARAVEKAQDIDQKVNLRRKLRAAWEDTKRMAPIWLRRTKEFGATTPGKAAFTFLFVGLLLSGTLFRLLNLLWLGWWVSVPLSLFLADQQRRKQRDQQQQQQRGDRGAGGSNVSGWDGTGPVVEAEWVSLDEKDNPKR